MATKKPTTKKAVSKPADTKSRGLTKPIPVPPKPAKQEPDVSEAYTPQFTGTSFMQRAQSQPL